MENKKRTLGAIWSSEKDYLQYYELQKKDRQELINKVLKLFFHYREGCNSALISVPDVLKILKKI